MGTGSLFTHRCPKSIVIIALIILILLLPALPTFHSVSGNVSQTQFAEKTAKDQREKGAPCRRVTPQAKSIGDGSTSSRPVLASADFSLLGLSVTASPANQTVPKNIPTSISITLPSFGIDPREIIDGLNPNLKVRGELVGPSLASPLTIESQIGQPLVVPALSRAGDHIIRNLRVVDTGEPGSPAIAPVTPDLCVIVVIDQILVSEIRVEELSYEEIVKSGISITDDSYRFFNFVLALATTSTSVNINLPVAFPDAEADDPRPVVGRPSSPVQIGVNIPTIDAVGVLLEVEEEARGATFNFDNQPVRIPGVVIFPGRVGFLNQFFEAIVIVSNGAPNGTPLVVRNLKAKVKLPDSGTPDDVSDDPLRIAATQTGGALTELEMRGLGADGQYGTSDDLTRFAPGQTGQASFLIEGLKEGLYSPSFELEGILEGLPVGPVIIRGEVPGAILVRDASFAVTFSHPSVVRAGNEYELAMTVYNSGNRDINGGIAQLFPNQINGASLIAGDTGERAFNTTIPKNGSSTVVWRLRANITGTVTASYVKAGEGIEAGLMLATGVGDRNVPLSPESLILPDEVRFLPHRVIEAGRSLLGQAWSIASAPRGSLPVDVMAITKTAIIDRAIEMGMAGLRVEFGEQVEVSLITLLRDWLGELQSAPDEGFADLIRNTTSGLNFYDEVGHYFQSRITAEPPFITASALHRNLVDAESPRSPFISALITQPEGAATFGARLVDPSGRKTGFLNSSSERVGDIRKSAALSLNNADGSASVGQMLIASQPVDGNWLIEFIAWQNGRVDISMLVPGQSSSYRHTLFGGVQIVHGREYRVRVRSGSTTGWVLEEMIDGAFRPTATVTEENLINEPDARLIGALQISEEVIASGDKYGRLVGLLFSKPMQRSSSEAASRYKITGGEIIGSERPSVIGKTINVRSAFLQLGSRFVFLALDAPVGPYIKREVTVSGVNDSRGVPANVSPFGAAIRMTVSREGRPPGAFLTGRVMRADESPVANASVVYWTQPCSPGEQPSAITLQKTDADGRYAIDYVRNGDCGGIVITATNLANGSQKRLTTTVTYDGQHVVMDMIFLARGNVRGSVMSGGVPASFALVKVVPHLDASIVPVVQADSLGRYSVDDLPIGPVTVFANGFGNLSTATGIAAGSIDGPGQTAIVNVSLENVSGVIRGRVINADLTPSIGSLVIARTELTGFPSDDSSGIPVGFAFTGRDGSFVIKALPLRTINLQVRDYVTNLSMNQVVHLSPATEEINGVMILLPGFGSIRGKVMDENGGLIPFAQVISGGRAVEADALGDYELINLRAGTYEVKATEMLSGSTGKAIVTVAVGETTSNVNIIITKPGTIRGQVFIINANGQSVPVANAIVTHDGIKQTTTDATGKYTIRDVHANSLFTLRFIHPNNRLAINFDTFVKPGETIIRDATFKSARLSGRIFQPDGLTGIVADITAFVKMPVLEPGGGYGLFELTEITTQSSGDGSYSLSMLNPGAYRLRASNAFFPTKVSKGGSLAPDEAEVCNITLVNRLAGKIQGRILQPDGVTHGNADVKVTLGGGSLADVIVKTDQNGHFEFAEVFAEGNYSLTATDPVTGFTNQITISVRQNEDVIVEMRLLGRGGIRVQVIDGAGVRVTSGSIAIDGTTYPRNHRFAEITSQSDGVIEFIELSEGDYAINAIQNGLSGRASVTVSNGSIVETTIQLHASGSIEGRVLMSDSVTAVELADVFLSINNRRIGVTVTSDQESQTGRFNFPLVQTGNFTLEAFDNRTGRMGRATGTITAQGQIAHVDIKLIAVGAVTGIVRHNGQPVDHALVSIDANGIARLQATTTVDGRYRFTGIPVGPVSINVKGGPGGLTGGAGGHVIGMTEPLADTVIDVTLQPGVTVTGTVFKFGGVERVAGAKVTLRAGARAIETTSDQNGNYRIEFAPLGELSVKAEAPSGFDRGESPVVNISDAETMRVINVTMAGTGNVAGNALDQNGNILNSGIVTYTNVELGSEIVLIGHVQPNGKYQIKGAPSGEFSLRLTVPGRAGAGVAISAIVANQTIELPVRMEDAGTIKGTVRGPDGITPAAHADVTLTIARGAIGIRLLGHTDSHGVFTFENVPLGTISINVNDPMTSGIASVSGLLLNANGQMLDAGTLTLDNRPISVESITPANGETDVVRNVTITVKFSEPVMTNSVHQSTVRLLKGTIPVAYVVSVLSDGRTVTITPSNLLDEFSAYTVIVTTGIRDIAGIPLAEEFRSSFITRDETGPIVTSVRPANNSVQISIDAEVVVTFNESLNAAQNLSSIVTLLAGSDTGVHVTGTVSMDDTGKIATFRPSSPLAESERYTVRVTGQRDHFGNIQTMIFTSTFATIDRTAPEIDPLLIDQTMQITKTPTITATYRDDLSGINASLVSLMLDGVNVTNAAMITANELSFQPVAPLSSGNHSIRVHVTDNVGNVATRDANFTIDNAPPSLTGFRIAGVTVVNGMTVTSSLRPIVEATYTDISGIDTNQTKLLFGIVGTKPVQMGAVVTATSLTFQPASNLVEGQYEMELIVVDNLGNSTTTGQIIFRLDADAPEITTVAPSSGNQHSSTIVTLAGVRLLNTNGTAPTVSLGGRNVNIANAIAGNPDRVIFIAPPNAPGAMTIAVTTDRGIGTLPGGFTYQSDPRTPFVAEHDTRMLWHLNEGGNGAIQLIDSGPLSIDGRASGSSLAALGRFDGGRTRLLGQTDADFGAFTFGMTSFTLECWMKTGPVGLRTILMGKTDGFGGSEQFSLELHPSGALIGKAVNSVNMIWQAEMGATMFDVDDNQWHSVAMVVDREARKMKLYVDGEERASVDEPTGFGALKSANTPVFIGFTPTSIFNGAIDEVRISSSAHSAEKIRQNYFGLDSSLVFRTSRTNKDQMLNALRGGIIAR